MQLMPKNHISPISTIIIIIIILNTLGSIDPEG